MRVVSSVPLGIIVVLLSEQGGGAQVPTPTPSPLKEIYTVTARPFCQSSQRNAFVAVKTLLKNEERISYAAAQIKRPEPGTAEMQFTINRIRIAVGDGIRELDAAQSAVDNVVSTAKTLQPGPVRDRALRMANALSEDIKIQREAINLFSDYAENMALRTITMNGSADAIISAVAFNPNNDVINQKDEKTAFSQMSMITADSVRRLIETLHLVPTADKDVSDSVVDLVQSCRQS